MGNIIGTERHGGAIRYEAAQDSPGMVQDPNMTNGDDVSSLEFFLFDPRDLVKKKSGGAIPNRAEIQAKLDSNYRRAEKRRYENSREYKELQQDKQLREQQWREFDEREKARKEKEKADLARRAARDAARKRGEEEKQRVVKSLRERYPSIGKDITRNVPKELVDAFLLKTHKKAKKEIANYQNKYHKDTDTYRNWIVGGSTLGGAGIGAGLGALIAEKKNRVKWMILGGLLGGLSGYAGGELGADPLIAFILKQRMKSSGKK